jgi:hypothetical protein
MLHPFLPTGRVRSFGNRAGSPGDTRKDLVGHLADVGHPAPVPWTCDAAREPAQPGAVAVRVAFVQVTAMFSPEVRLPLTAG